MRKLAVASVATLGALAVTTPTALAVNADQSIAVKASPASGSGTLRAGTKAKPAGVKFKVTTTTTPKDNTAFATKQAVIYLDKNLVFNGAKFASCTADQLQQSEANCPKGSKVGSGSATGRALGIEAPLTVTAFNAAKGKQLLLHVVGSQPIAIDSVMVGKLANASGKFGKKLIVDIPANLQQPIPNVFATLLNFSTTLKATSKGVPYVGLKGCTGGKLNFAGDFFFTDGDKKSATTTAKCAAAKK